MASPNDKILMARTTGLPASLTKLEIWQTAPCMFIRIIIDFPIQRDLMFVSIYMDRFKFLEL